MSTEFCTRFGFFCNGHWPLATPQAASGQLFCVPHGPEILQQIQELLPRHRHVRSSGISDFGEACRSSTSSRFSTIRLPSASARVNVLSKSSPTMTPCVTLAVVRRDDPGRERRGDLLARQQDRLDQLGAIQLLADGRQFGTDLPAAAVDAMADGTAGTAHVETRVLPPRRRPCRPVPCAMPPRRWAIDRRGRPVSCVDPPRLFPFRPEDQQDLFGQFTPFVRGLFFLLRQVIPPRKQAPTFLVAQGDDRGGTAGRRAAIRRQE